MVDLPEPEGPAITITSPRATLRSTPSRTTLSPNAFRMPRSDTRKRGVRGAAAPRWFLSLMFPSPIAQPTGCGGALIGSRLDGRDDRASGQDRGHRAQL